MAQVRLKLGLRGAGWARLDIAAESGTRSIESISYLTDALDDLLRMGIDIATDKGWSFAIFDHEPAQTVFVAETAWWEGASWAAGARLSAISDSEIGNAEVGWDFIRRAEREFIIPVGSRDELAGLFLEMAQDILREHGEDGYRKSWGGGLAFPVRAMKALEAALAIPTLPALNYEA